MTTIIKRLMIFETAPFNIFIHYYYYSNITEKQLTNIKRSKISFKLNTNIDNYNTNKCLKLIKSICLLYNDIFGTYYKYESSIITETN